MNGLKAMQLVHHAFFNDVKNLIQSSDSDDLQYALESASKMIEIEQTVSKIYGEYALSALMTGKDVEWVPFGERPEKE